MSPASARSMKELHSRAMAATWGVPNDTEKKVDQVRDQPQHQSPTTGRNTRMGKKAEKPRDPRSGGPSGQKDRARHDKRHANK